MRTRRGACYPCHSAAAGEGPEVHRRKRRRTAAGAPAGFGVLGDMFEELPDDLVVSILADVAASAGSPADLAGAMLTCKRFRELGQSRVVLARASPRCVAVPAKAWSDEAHRFLQRCADAGNLEACYLLGMIRFYCLGSRGSGAALMAAAAVGGHREALYSLAVIQFNGSGGSKDDRDLRAGAALCARAASLGHVDALRELGHCLQDGYGVLRSVLDGRRLLIQANARELAAAVTASASLLRAGTGNNGGKASRRHSCLLSDFGCRAAAAAAGETHAANRFLVDWFASRPLAASAVGAVAGTPSAAEDDGAGAGDLRLCSHALCGRPETRRHEFRRCSVCGVVNYCSRACQALHWKMAHKAECTPMERWLDAAANANAAAGDVAVAAPAP
ncbi:F-box protein At5g50450-like [Phragmites australis]|uniref:F-box protein At5g50450-like n=1 Tax=Phragmites australis TaxID=29695 RepID=UPI002D79DB10|nr:F-box protein At5g50450-like [Phragmites australis]